MEGGDIKGWDWSILQSLLGVNLPLKLLSVDMKLECLRQQVWKWLNCTVYVGC